MFVYLLGGLELIDYLFKSKVDRVEWIQNRFFWFVLLEIYNCLLIHAQQVLKSDLKCGKQGFIKRCVKFILPTLEGAICLWECEL